MYVRGLEVELLVFIRISAHTHVSYNGESKRWEIYKRACKSATEKRISRRYAHFQYKYKPQGAWTAD